MARVIFMGTPQFAIPTLQGLVEHHTVVAVVTQPDRPAGRGRQPAPPPVKQFALEHGLPLLQPPRLTVSYAQAALAELEAQVSVVAAFGQILRQEVLDLPRHGTLNVHASLLPRWRGASPVSAAILAGDERTGVTIMLLDAGMDTGPLLAQKECPIRPDDTTGTLSERLAQLGADLLLDTLPRWIEGQITPRPQNQAEATYSRPLEKKDGLIDWQRSSAEIGRQVRACQPWPGAYTSWGERQIKILRAEPLAQKPPQEPGTVVQLGAGLAVSTGDGYLLLEELQAAGKRPTSAQAFAHGARGFIGARLKT
jgi:methionyl-tRNA formyltransferase